MTPEGPASTPLRILVVNWQDRENPQAGGAEAHLHEVFGRLARRGHAVTLLASGWNGAPARTELDGIDVHRTGRRHTFSVAAPRYHRRHLAGRVFDVVVEDLNKVPLFTPWWTEAPVVLLVHHLFGATAFKEASAPVAAVTWLMERAVPAVYRGLPVIAVSDSTREDLVRRGLDGADIEVATNGVDLDRFTPGPDAERFEIPTVVFLGRLKRYKGVDLLIRAVARIPEHRPVRLLVGGRGDARADLEALVEELGVDHRVDFLGFVTEEHKLELFRRAWLHALTSPKEGWGITNIEAAACATPTVASDSPGLRESVRDGVTGRLVPHGDVDALADVVGHLLDAPDTLREMGREARAFAAGFSWDQAADRVEERLRRVVAGPAPG